ncbi:Tripartite tricarboxylate transporter family receptor [compost metagenome]
MFVGLPSVDPFIKDGSMRIVATAESERSEQRPDIPTIKEQGYPGVYASNWFGIIGPAALPPAVTKRLADATAEIVKTNEFRQRMESLGAEPLAISSDQFKALYNADRERWHDLIDANHLKLE